VPLKGGTGTLGEEFDTDGTEAFACSSELPDPPLAKSSVLSSKRKAGSSFHSVWMATFDHSLSRSLMLGLSPRITNHHFLIEPFCSDLNFLLIVSFSTSEPNVSILMALPIVEQVADFIVPQTFHALWIGTRLLKLVPEGCALPFTSPLSCTPPLPLLEFLPCPYSGFLP